jgi:hypothetical protein
MLLQPHWPLNRIMRSEKQSPLTSMTLLKLLNEMLRDWKQMKGPQLVNGPGVSLRVAQEPLVMTMTKATLIRTNGEAMLKS